MNKHLRTLIRLIAVLVLAVAALSMGAFAQSAAEPDLRQFDPFSASASRTINGFDFSPDGQQLYFTLNYHRYLEEQERPTDGAPRLALFTARLQGEAWEEPQLLPFSGTYNDYEPVLAQDGSLLIFNTRRPYAGEPAPEENDLWMAERRGQEWLEPVPITTVNTFDGFEAYASITTDRTIVFVKGWETESGSISYDLFWSRFENGEFLEPELHPVSEVRWGEGDPWIAPDGSYLIFTRWDDAIGWEETVDLYISFADEGQWTPPAAVDWLNTSNAEFSPVVSSDGQWFYYRSGSQIMVVELAKVLERYRGQ